jgi:hypothetical protein
MDIEIIERGHRVGGERKGGREGGERRLMQNLITS